MSSKIKGLKHIEGKTALNCCDTESKYFRQERRVINIVEVNQENNKL